MARDGREPPDTMAPVIHVDVSRGGGGTPVTMPLRVIANARLSAIQLQRAGGTISALAYPMLNVLLPRTASIGAASMPGSAGSGRRVRVLAAPDPCVDIHPSMPRMRGMAPGDLVQLASRPVAARGAHASHPNYDQ